MAITKDNRNARRRASYAITKDEINARKREIYASDYKETVLSRGRSHRTTCPSCGKPLRYSYVKKHIALKHPTA